MPTPAQASVRVALRWRDMDMLGHLNQAVYHEFLEEARGAVFEGLEGIEHFPFVLARVELDYKAEVRRELGHVDVTAVVEKVGRTSVTLTHEIRKPDGAVAAAGRSVLVAWDPQARGARELHDGERAALGG